MFKLRVVSRLSPVRNSNGGYLDERNGLRQNTPLMKGDVLNNMKYSMLHAIDA
jgi:hypothetical protein